jgi:hypothetical protein
MPEVQIQPDGPSDEQAAAEAQKISDAKAQLADEVTQTGTEDNKILGKYNTVDDLIQAHKSLQAEYTRVRQGLSPSEPEAEQEAPKAEQEPQPEQDQKEQPEPLDPETARQIVDSIMETAGGEDKFRAIQDWANKNPKISDERKTAFNEAIREGRLQEALTQFKALQYDFISENGWEPPLVRGREATQTIQPFRSDGEVKAAMSDPRFDSTGPRFDRAYHDDVIARLSASPNVLATR